MSPSYPASSVRSALCPDPAQHTASDRSELGRQSCRTLEIALDAAGEADEAGAEVDEGEVGTAEGEEEAGADEASGTGQTRCVTVLQG